jgi:hypothetical protein
MSAFSGNTFLALDKQKNKLYLIKRQSDEDKDIFHSFYNEKKLSLFTPSPSYYASCSYKV